MADDEEYMSDQPLEPYEIKSVRRLLKRLEHFNWLMKGITIWAKLASIIGPFGFGLYMGVQHFLDTWGKK